MIEWIKCNKIKSLIITILFLGFIFIGVPIVLNHMYYRDALFDFMYVDYDISNILDYYGATLTFTGTLILGAITIYQNHIAQEKTNEVNRLTLELQKKNMIMAEQSYEKQKKEEIIRSTPKFEIKCNSANGKFSNLNVTMKNICEINVTSIISLSFEVLNKDNKVINKSDNVKIKDTSIFPDKETLISFNNDCLEKQNTMVWKFECEDNLARKHYYKASLSVEDSNKWSGDLWNTEKIG